MRNRYLIGAGVALAMALSWADARAQLFPLPTGPGTIYFGVEGGYTNLEDATGRARVLSTAESNRESAPVKLPDQLLFAVMPRDRELHEA